MPDLHSFFRDHRFYQDLQSETITLNWTRRDSLRGISGQTVGALDGLNLLKMECGEITELPKPDPAALRLRFRVS